MNRHLNGPVLPDGWRRDISWRRGRGTLKNHHIHNPKMAGYPAARKGAEIPT
jgi:hypothetical protein